jgi:hypothetical protein
MKVKRTKIILCLISALSVLSCAGAPKSGGDGGQAAQDDAASWKDGQLVLVDEMSNFGKAVPSFVYFEGEDNPKTGEVNPVKWVEGHQGQGIDLDDGHIHTMIRFINPIAGHPEDFDWSPGAITVNTWIYWRGGGRRTLSGEYNDDKDQVIFAVNGALGTFRVSVNDQGNSGLMAQAQLSNRAAIPVIPDVPLPQNEWHMVTAVMDGKTIALYLDGKELGRASCTYRITEMRPGIFRIGGASWGPPTLNAIIDQASYWKRALPPAAVAALYESTR